MKTAIFIRSFMPVYQRRENNLVKFPKKENSLEWVWKKDGYLSIIKVLYKSLGKYVTTNLKEKQRRVYGNI